MYVRANTWQTDRHITGRETQVVSAEAQAALLSGAAVARFGQQLDEVMLPAWVNSVDWSPSGNTVAAACHDGAVYFWKPRRVLADAPNSGVTMAMHEWGSQ
jgi:WD40 repeat protein